MASYYRFFVAFLAAFGCFFAYFCRLNLSLVINEMVESDVITMPDLASDELINATNNLEATNEALTGIKFSRFEEQTLAELSSGRPWWMRNQPSKQRMPIIRRNQSLETLRENTMRMLQGNSVKTLRIEQEFDVQEASKQRQDNEKRSTQDTEWLTNKYLLSPLPKLKWSKEARNDLLGAFFLGYVIFQVPAARAAEIFGAKTLMLVLGFGTGLASIFFVASTRLFGDDSIWAAYLVRLVMGASQAGLFPSVYVLYCKWLPRTERSSLLPVASAFGRLGTIVMNFAAPIVLRQYGWPMVFMMSGGGTLVWAVLFLVFGSSSPAASRWLSSSELLHIESRMEPSVGSLKRPAAISTASIDDHCTTNCAKPKNSMDWLKVLTNKPIGVLTVVMFSSEWSNMLLLVLLPSFLGSALRMELEQIGTWTIALVTVYCVGYPLAGTAASWLERATCCRLSSLNIRKLFEAVAHLLQAAGCLLIASYRNTTVILLALFLIMLGRSTVGGGQCLMPPELSKEYPGTVMAYANAIANLACYFGPMIVNLIVDEPSKLESWRSLWFISAGLFLVCGLIFVFFADNSPQDLARKPGPSKSISQMQLTLPPYIPPAYNPDQEAADDVKKEDQQSEPKRRAPKPPTRDIQTRMTAFSSQPAGSSSAGRCPGPRPRSPSLTRRI